MTNYKYIFFDVANTLLFKPQLFPTIKHVLEKHEFDIELSHLQLIHKLLSETTIFPDKTSKEFYHQFNSELLYALGIIPTPTLLDDIFKACSYLPWEVFTDTDFLKTIRIPIGIISNWDTTLAQKLSTYFDINFFSLSVSAVEGIKKPDVRFYEKAIEKLDCDPTEILYIGDSIKLDIEPAKKIGIHSILIDRDNIFTYSKLDRISSFYQLDSYLN